MQGALKIHGKTGKKIQGGATYIRNTKNTPKTPINIGIWYWGRVIHAIDNKHTLASHPNHPKKGTIAANTRRSYAARQTTHTPAMSKIEEKKSAKPKDSQPGRSERQKQDPKALRTHWFLSKTRKFSSKTEVAQLLPPLEPHRFLTKAQLGVPTPLKN